MSVYYKALSVSLMGHLKSGEVTLCFKIILILILKKLYAYAMS